MFVPSLTTNWNVSVPAAEGAVNVGCTTVLLDNVTAVPPVWLHRYDSESPSESKLPDPSSVTTAPAPTV